MTFWVIIFNAIAIGLAFWTMMGGDSYGISLAACVVLPWLTPALVAFSDKRIAISGTKSENRPDLFIAAFAPAMAVCAKMLKDFDMIDWKLALIFGAALSLAWTLALVTAKNMSQSAWATNRFGEVFVITFWLIAGTSYGYGLVALVNGAGDKPPVKTVKASVVDKSESGGRSKSFYLHLEPGVLDNARVSVARPLYNDVQTGDRICVNFYKGNIGLKWYELRRCAADDVA